MNQESAPTSDDRLRRRARHAKNSWLRLRQAIVDEIIDKLPLTVPLDFIPMRLSIPPSEIRKGVADGTLVTAEVDGAVHMVCAESAVFLQAQGRIRLPLPESLRPVGAASTLRVWEPIFK